jgi:hypothetical protein
MYVPEVVKITTPKIETPEVPYCYYKNFMLEWNADLKNENGLVVAIEWAGTDMFGTHYKEVIRNADVIQIDNGKTVLKNEIFDGIPHGAMVKLLLIRGNIEKIEKYINEEETNQEFNIVAVSEAILPVSLVREIEN